MPGEACCAAVLCRDLSRKPYGTIRGSAVVRNTIHHTAQLLAPDIAAQERVICDALATSGCRADQLSMMHVHGIGTPVSDTSEIHAITAACGAMPLALASHKGLTLNPIHHPC